MACPAITQLPFATRICPDTLSATPAYAAEMFLYADVDSPSIPEFGSGKTANLSFPCVLVALNTFRNMPCSAKSACWLTVNVVSLNMSPGNGPCAESLTTCTSAHPPLMGFIRCVPSGSRAGCSGYEAGCGALTRVPLLTAKKG